jgi:hypothetical protein
MRRRPIVVVAAAVAVLLGASSAIAGPGADPRESEGQPLRNDHAYVFTQQQRDNLSWWNGTWVPQTVPNGAHVQVQLPSGPIRWVPDTGPGCRPGPVAGLVPTRALPLRADVELEDHSTLPNEDRITGSTEISVFDYRVDGLGIASICLRPEPVPDDPGVLGFPPGTPPTYVVTVVVGGPSPPCGDRTDRSARGPLRAAGHCPVTSGRQRP